MKSSERGNAILISAILVFALTVAALGVSRLLIKGVQGMTAQREFLATQAQAHCEAAILRWVRDNTIGNRATAQPSYNLLRGLAGSPPALVGVTVRVPTGAVDFPDRGPAPPVKPDYTVSATAQLTSVADDPLRPGVKMVVQRTVVAEVTNCNNTSACDDLNPKFKGWAP